MARVIGIDYGTVRVGVAISDPLATIARPLPYLPATPRRHLLGGLGRLVRENDVDTIVVGLPRHMSGEEGESAEAARELGERIAAKLGVNVEYIDERLSSAAAERRLVEADLSRAKRKEKIDSLAAAMILQTWLDREAGGGFVMPPMNT